MYEMNIPIFLLTFSSVMNIIPELQTNRHDKKGEKA